MQENWSLILNVILLISVIFAIHRMMKARRQSLQLSNYEPPVNREVQKPQHHDDIIAVRKVNIAENDTELEPAFEPKIRPSLQQTPIQPTIVPGRTFNKSEPRVVVTEESKPVANKEQVPSLMMFLLAKENRQLAGYELLQTVLASGLRFGEGQLFHRHQSPNGQGPVLCSLAAATPTGVFDLQNIGAFSVHGLCLFMRASGNPTIDGERFAIMLDTAKQLSEGLDTFLLDDQRQPLSDKSIDRYYRRLNLDEMCAEPVGD